MTRLAANKIYLSSTKMLINSVIELSENHTLSNIYSLNNTSEIHSTPFYNGIIVPYSKEECQNKLTNNYFSTKDLFNQDSFEQGMPILHLSLIKGEQLFSHNIYSEIIPLL